MEGRGGGEGWRGGTILLGYVATEVYISYKYRPHDDGGKMGERLSPYYALCGVVPRNSVTSTSTSDFTGR